MDINPTHDIHYYIHCFKKLRRDRKKGGAPHKPILLLSLIQLIESGHINSNRIYLSPELVSLFKTNWGYLVETDHQMLFPLPFYHMKSEPFWRLKSNIGCEKWVDAKSAMRTFANLNEAVRYAEIDNELFSILKQPQENNELKLFLLDHYFPDTKQNYPHSTRFQDLDEIAQQIIEEPASDYQQRVIQLEKTLGDSDYQQETFLRSHIFKREVPRIYDYTCCISGLRIDATLNVSMIDACHIIPFAESHNDSITNGLALCPNLHRAFDRGLIAIDKDYQVMINPNFTEPKESVYSIMQFAGRQIILPRVERYYPDFSRSQAPAWECLPSSSA
ncbi:MAG: putative restriction endonuclease [Methyloprofundus sp.]|nr:MAG: putative restriction endonuclease [Methyloprofundus sp.]